MDPVLVAAIIPALPALLAWLTARPWITARVREVEYWEKRLAIVTSFLVSHSKVLSAAEVEAMNEEARFVGRTILASSCRLEKQRVRAWKSKVWWKRLFALPWPASGLEWILAFAFYVYALAAGGYLVVASLVWARELQESSPWAATILGIGGLSCVVITVAAKSWNVRNSASLGLELLPGLGRL